MDENNQLKSLYNDILLLQQFKIDNNMIDNNMVDIGEYTNIVDKLKFRIGLLKKHRTAEIALANMAELEHPNTTSTKDVSSDDNKPDFKFKYHEQKILLDTIKYISTTYEQHYVGDNDVSTIDLIASIGHGDGFCIGNAIKYLARYGKKKGKNHVDLMKAIHYIVLCYHFNHMND